MKMVARFGIIASLALVWLRPATTDNHNGKVNTKFSATSEFAFDFYKQIAASTKASKNIVFSPLSIYVAFAMLKAGAKQNTEDQMEKALRWHKLIENSGLSDGHAAVKSLMQDVFGGSDKNNTVDVANKLWMQKYFCASSCNGYINTLRKNYNAELGELNFVREAEKCRKEINQWVEDKTNSKIKELLPKGSVGAMTRFVLTNAVYFKGKWKSPFEKKYTKLRYFSINDGEGSIQLTKVPMMFQNARVYAAGFSPSSPYQLLELPYEGDKLSMLILLPRESHELYKLERELSSAKLNKLLGELYEYPSTKIDVYLPKFKFTTSIDLNKGLEKMGMKDVFDRTKADLSGITGYRGMFVSKALHKAFINVDEEGTEAAAATGIIIELASLPFQFKIDKPFMFMIRDNPTGTILFMGRVIDPTAD